MQQLYNLIIIIIIIFLNLFNYIQTIETQSLNLTVGTCIIQYSEVCAGNFVKFYLSSGKRPNDEPILLNNDQPILPRWLPRQNDFKVIIHGYGGNNEFNGTKGIQIEYMKRSNTTVITVDWGRLAIFPCYPTAAVNTRQAGECIATFLFKIQKHNVWFNPSDIHLIGFSLGGHVAGFVSNAIEKILKKKVRRITGLDPALPLFTSSNVKRRLDQTDAEFVDVIHTNAGIFGKIEAIGHVDFYVNGGQIQPMCNESNNIPLCSHIMSTVYFSESITSDIGFWGIRCSSYFQYVFGWCSNNSTITNSDLILMGEYVSESTRGIIFVYTNFESPYAIGKDNLLRLDNIKTIN